MKKLFDQPNFLSKKKPSIFTTSVTGFIGPEIFRTKEQLLRVALEVIFMGKMHGLTVGVDICATLHMDVTIDDLDWCIQRIMPAHPAFVIALPTKTDPLLGILTVSF